MYPREFDYHRATSADEALALLRLHPGAKFVAGGHSLLPMMKLRLAQPGVLIDIGRLEELKGISDHEDTFRVGALTTHAELAASKALRADCPILAEAAAQIADPQVRNKGTIGGNIAHADPASDLPAVLVVLGATVHLRSRDAARSVVAGDFFVDLLATSLAEDEIITEIEIPKPGTGTGTCYLKVEHPASGYAVCGAAASINMDGGACSQARLAFNGVTAIPHLASEVTDELVGTDAGDNAIDEAILKLTMTDPLSDTYASGEYRLALALAYGKRALKAARDRAS